MSDTHESQTAEEHSNEPSTRAEPGPPDDLGPPLTSLIASIRAGVARGASADVRAAGATACRAILSVLEAKPGQPLAATPSPANPPTSPIMALLAQPGLLSKLAAMSREQLLDLLKQVTGATPTASRTPASAGPRFHIVEVPGRGPR